MKLKNINLEDYPIIKNYEVYHNGSCSVTRKGGKLMSLEETMQYINFCDKLHERIANLKNKREENDWVFFGNYDFNNNWSNE